MRLLSRDFTIKEKVLLGILALILIGLLYYQFVDVPVRDTIRRCEDAKASLEIELEAVQVRIDQLEKMKNEIDKVQLNGTLKRMPSYNNSKNVNKLLNDVLGDMGYTITFSEATRDGDQVRRNITIQFNAPDNASVRRVLDQLVENEYRCLIGNVICNSPRYNVADGNVVVNVTVTFFETTVGGVVDVGLPTDE